MARKQRIDIGKYCFVNRTIELWHRLPAETIATFCCVSHIIRKKVRKVIIKKVLVLSFSHTFHHLNILSPKHSVPLFYLGTFCQINVILSVSKSVRQCAQSNKTGCQREPPCFSLLSTSLLKVANFLLYAFFWVIPRSLNFICRSSIFLGR